MIFDFKIGVSCWQQFEVVYCQIGKKFKSLRIDLFLDGIGYLWGWFCELGDCFYIEIYYWVVLKCIYFLFWEVDVLWYLDYLRLKVWND